VIAGHTASRMTDPSSPAATVSQLHTAFSTQSTWHILIGLSHVRGRGLTTLQTPERKAGNLRRRESVQNTGEPVVCTHETAAPHLAGSKAPALFIDQ